MKAFDNDQKTNSERLAGTTEPAMASVDKLGQQNVL